MQTEETTENTIPTRAELPDSDKWDLSHLFVDVGKWQEDFAWVQAHYGRLSEWKGKLGRSAGDLAACLEFEKELDLKIERLYHFASLQLSEDGANTEYLGRVGQLQNLLTIIGEAAAFLGPEIQAIDDTRWAAFMDDPALKEWRVRLHKIRRMRPPCFERTGRAAARAWIVGDGRLRRCFFAVNECRHEIRHAHRR